MPPSVPAAILLALSVVVVALAVSLPGWPRLGRVGLLLLAAALGLESALYRYFPNAASPAHRLILVAAIGYSVAGALALWQARRRR